MSFQELTKRQSFIRKIDDIDIKRRLLFSINDRKFWSLCEAIV